MTLFISAFLAATLFPFSSEAALVAALSAGMEHATALTAASAGNILAILVNYLLGFWLYEKSHTKLEASKTGRKALAVGHRYGYAALLLSWLPIIGDPLTLVAGLVRLNIVWFILIAGSLRVARYWLIAQAF
ncbi:DedA family protein [Sulfurimonas sp. HSL-3221]|uniref:YqaA family protein n=1 Tax=Sulfurimonadaceae TaxID=2771471 RepID=UPI001E4080BF|nr:DedA family protein [Sulfurimonas sp. HSL-3221]UFS62642.1 DedA family protein [Sulfurimonas sp. HSL-3221]